MRDGISPETRTKARGFARGGASALTLGISDQFLVPTPEEQADPAFHHWEDGGNFGTSLFFAMAGGKPSNTGPTPVPQPNGAAAAEIAWSTTGVGSLVIGAFGISLATSGGGDSDGLIENEVPGKLEQELAEAERVGARPIKPGTPEFEAAVNQGTIKWVVTDSGELLITPHTVQGKEISHAVLSGGRPVKAAGHAEVAAGNGKFFGIEINPGSGHFPDSGKSLDVGIDAFGKAGIKFR